MWDCARVVGFVWSCCSPKALLAFGLVLQSAWMLPSIVFDFYVPCSMICSRVDSNFAAVVATSSHIE